MLTAWSLLVLITASHCNPLENGETVLAQNTNQNIPVDTNDNTDIILNVLLEMRDALGLLSRKFNILEEEKDDKIKELREKIEDIQSENEELQEMIENVQTENLELRAENREKLRILISLEEEEDMEFDLFG